MNLLKEPDKIQITRSHFDGTSYLSIIDNTSQLKLQAASTPTKRKKQHVNTNRTNDKPWFNQSCKNLRNIYHRTRRAYNKYKTVYFKNLLKDVSKQYKSKLRKADNDFNEKRVVNLRLLKSKNPREYWNMLNTGSKTSKLL